MAGSSPLQTPSTFLERGGGLMAGGSVDRLPAGAWSDNGFAVVRGVLTSDECQAIASSLPRRLAASAGSRCVLSFAWCGELAARLRVSAGLAELIPPGYVASQCTYFAKSTARNWLVPVHQDLSIPVAERVDAPCLQGWSEKEGALFVQPPVELLERLVAVRLHLDPCEQSDGPLEVVPGTHRQGRIEPEAASAARSTRPVVSCALDRGDALVMRPLLLHASSKASGSSLRRVLHFVFGPPELPFGLRWQRAV